MLDSTVYMYNVLTGKQSIVNGIIIVEQFDFKKRNQIFKFIGQFSCHAWCYWTVRVQICPCFSHLILKRISLAFQCCLSCMIYDSRTNSLPLNPYLKVIVLQFSACAGYGVKMK